MKPKLLFNRSRHMGKAGTPRYIWIYKELPFNPDHTSWSSHSNDLLSTDLYNCTFQDVVLIMNKPTSSGSYRTLLVISGIFSIRASTPDSSGRQAYSYFIYADETKDAKPIHEITKENVHDIVSILVLNTYREYVETPESSPSKPRRLNRGLPRSVFDHYYKHKKKTKPVSTERKLSLEL